MIHLDAAASTPTAPEVLEAMRPWSSAANPASSHQPGRDAALAVALARRQLATAIGCLPEELAFTSGATESNNAALRGAVRPAAGDGLVVSAVEHHAVLEPAEELGRAGARVLRAPVDRFGRVDVGELMRMIPLGCRLVSVMAANNETGTIQYIAEIAAMLPRGRSRPPLLHVDCAQAVPFVPVDLAGVDLASFSAHKFHGPKGVGALYVRRGVPWRAQQLGGEQEHGRRAGTVPVPLVVGMAAAAMLAWRSAPRVAPELWELTTLAARELGRLGCRLLGEQNIRHPGILAVLLPLGSGPELVAELGDRVALSAGAACSTGAGSHVALAMGSSPLEARRLVRIAPELGTTRTDIHQAVALVGRYLDRQR